MTTDKERKYQAAYRVGYRERRKVIMRRWRYGVTAEQWDAVFAAQGHGCGICGRAEPDHGKGWALDHDHATGKFRGILCTSCNLGIGKFADNPEALRRAAAYLEGPR